MTTYPSGTVAVIFVSKLTGVDADGYDKAGMAMATLAGQQSGYLGIDSVRDGSGLGITISYWADEATAVAWRQNEEHTAIRDTGRNRWYSYYDLHVAAISRSYDWQKG